MQRDTWRTPYINAPRQVFRRRPTETRHPIVLKVTPAWVTTVPASRPTPPPLSLDVTREHVAPKVIEDLIELLIGLPQIVPSELIDPNSD